MDCDVIIIGGGLAGLACASELLRLNKKVLLLERDAVENLGGLARRSFGGVMLVDTPLQRKSGIHDSPELAFQDWLSYAEFSKDDSWPREWAKLYTEKSISLIYEWLVERKVTFLPVVNWPERGLYLPGNSVPRWHIAWGTGHSIIEQTLKFLDEHHKRNNLEISFQHKVEGFIEKGGNVCGCYGKNEITGKEFQYQSDSVVVSCGGYTGGDLKKVKSHWYKDWGKPPETLLNGSHKYADGLLHGEAQKLGANITHMDMQWHYAAGIKHPVPEPGKYRDGLSLVPPKSALWMDATGKRFGPQPLVGFSDTRFLVEQITKSEHQYSWQIMNWKIAIKELAVSGSDYMEAFRNKQKIRMVRELLLGNKSLVNRLIKESEDFVVANSLDELAEKMNRLNGNDLVDVEKLKADVKAWDNQIDRGIRYFNDDQLRRIQVYRNYKGDRLRTCKFQKIDDQKAMPLIAIREFILSRKSIGGIQTNLNNEVLKEDGTVLPGLYAIGETAGFGGGGIHGKRSLEGTFLGACILTGRTAARAISGGK